MLLCKRFMLTAVICIVLSHHAPSVAALYSGSDKVRVLTAKDFKRFIIESNLPAMVEFYAPWCGHCQQLTQIYSRVAENLYGIVTIAAVDCDVDGNKQLCGQYGVKGFPTLKVFPASQQKNSRTGRLNKTPEDYNGPRSAKSIADAASAGLTDALIQRPSSQSEFNKFRSSGTIPKVVLVTHKKKTSTLFMSLSMRFRGRLAFAEIRNATGEIAKGLGVEAPPSLFVLSDEGNATAYKGNLKAKDLVDFLKPFGGAKSKGNNTAGSTTDSSSKQEGRPQPSSKPTSRQASASDQALALLELSLPEVDTLLDTDTVWLLATYQGPQGPQCAAQAVKLAKAARTLGTLARVARVNMTAASESEVADRGLGLPPAGDSCDHVLSLKPYGEQSEPEESFPVFQGNISEAKELQTFVLKGFSDSGVQFLSKASMQAFMVQKPGGMKVLLFTNKDTTPPIFAALAANIQRELPSTAFAIVHQRESEILSDFKVTAVPKLQLAWTEESEKKDEAGQPLVTARLQPYQGPLKYDRMAEFVRMMSSMISTAAAEAAGSRDADVAATAFAQEAKSTADLQRMCPPTTSLCVVGLLNPGMGDHPERIASLRVLSLKWTSQVAFLWLDVRQQPDVLKAFGATAGDAPTAVILATRKLRFVLLEGGMDSNAQSLDALVAAALAGELNTKALQELPQLSEAAQPAEEAAAAKPDLEKQPEESGAQTIEDEFDLEDLMAEETGSSTQANADRLAQIDAQIKAEKEKMRQQEEAAAKAAQKAKAAETAKAAAEARAERKRKREAAATAAEAEKASVKDEL